MKKYKLLLKCGIFIFATWLIAVIYGLSSLLRKDNHPTPQQRHSDFYIEGKIQSAKYLYSNHGDMFLITLKPTKIDIVNNALTDKDDLFWGVYDKKKNLIYFVMDYWSEEFEEEAFENVKIVSGEAHYIQLNNEYIGNLLLGYNNNTSVIKTLNI